MSEIAGAPRDIEVGAHRIGRSHPPFVIAEMSGNHNGSLDRALRIVAAAAAAGAHALKLQTYTASTMTVDIDAPEFRVNDPSSPWHGRLLYELYQAAATPWEWHEPIFKRCTELGLVGFSTPFDGSAVDHLESLGVSIYKIASMESTDVELIRRVAATGKPMLISTGSTTLVEIGEAVQTARSAGCEDLVLLKCTAEYPADPADANLATIAHLRDSFRTHVGLSDHTSGVGVSVAAAALGAVVIEKHLTLRRSDGGVDSSFSLEPEELRLLVDETDRAWKAVGEVRYTSDQERTGQSHRRTLLIVRDVKAGERLTAESVQPLRPGLGLPVKDLDAVIGRRARKDLRRGTPISWELLD